LCLERCGIPSVGGKEKGRPILIAEGKGQAFPFDSGRPLAGRGKKKKECFAPLTLPAHPVTPRLNERFGGGEAIDIENCKKKKRPVCGSSR